MINDQDVLLVVGTSLEGPVEGAGQDELAIDDHELVVHVVLGRVISSNLDTGISKLLDVVTLVLSALVI